MQNCARLEHFLLSFDVISTQIIHNFLTQEKLFRPSIVYLYVLTYICVYMYKHTYVCICNSLDIFILVGTDVSKASVQCGELIEKS